MYPDAGKLIAHYLETMKALKKTTNSVRLINELVQLLLSDDNYLVFLKTLLGQRLENGTNALSRLFVGLKDLLPTQVEPKSSLVKQIAREMIYWFAFRQRFQAKDCQVPNGVFFYKTIWIEKGNKRSRRIDIPIPCLRIIQRYLLNRYLNFHLSRLPDFIVSKPRGSAIKGASFHLDAKYAVNVDIKDFFPSINASMVIPTLGRLARKKKDGVKVYTFNHMASVWVGRLLTYRNFLPQGSPASPAIANLVFYYLDKEIRKELGTQFGYSRYIDDITISISSSEAKTLIIDNLEDMRRRVLSTIEKVFSNSKFRLNRSKIRCTEASKGSGHFVTGYHVRDGKITMSKVDRRFFRGLAKRLENAGFNLATLVIGFVPRPAKGVPKGQVNKNKFLAESASFVFDNAKGRHFHPARRLSLESLASKLAFRFHPGLKISCVSTGTQLGIKDLSLLATEQMQAFLEGIFGLLWIGELIAVIGDKPNSLLVTRPDNTLVCCLSSENRPDFFMLPKTVAWACMDYYMWISGHLGRLHVPDDLRRIAMDIHLLRLSFQDYFKKLTVKVD